MTKKAQKLMLILGLGYLVLGQLLGHKLTLSMGVGIKYPPFLTLYMLKLVCLGLTFLRVIILTCFSNVIGNEFINPNIFFK